MAKVRCLGPIGRSSRRSGRSADRADPADRTVQPTAADRTADPADPQPISRRSRSGRRPSSRSAARSSVTPATNPTGRRARRAAELEDSGAPNSSLSAEDVAALEKLIAEGRLRPRPLGRRTMAPRVLLVSMPFAALERPSLGLSLLQAELQRGRRAPATRATSRSASPTCIGLQELPAGSPAELPYTAFAGDWLFTAALYGAAAGGRRRLRAARSCATSGSSTRRRSRGCCGCARYVRAVPRPLPALGRRGTTTTSSASRRRSSRTSPRSRSPAGSRRRARTRRSSSAARTGRARWAGSCTGASRSSTSSAPARPTESFPAARRARATAGDRARSAASSTARRCRAARTGPAPLVRDLDALPIAGLRRLLPRRSRRAAGRGGGHADADVRDRRAAAGGARSSHCTFCGLNGGSRWRSAASAPSARWTRSATLARPLRRRR